MRGSQPPHQPPHNSNRKDTASQLAENSGQGVSPRKGGHWPPRQPAPEAQRLLAQRFNAGKAHPKNHPEPRRGGASPRKGGTSVPPQSQENGTRAPEVLCSKPTALTTFSQPLLRPPRPNRPTAHREVVLVRLDIVYRVTPYYASDYGHVCPCHQTRPLL